MVPKTLIQQCQSANIGFITEWQTDSVWHGYCNYIPILSPFVTNSWFRVLTTTGWQIVILHDNNNTKPTWMLPLAFKRKLGLTQIHSLPWDTPSNSIANTIEPNRTEQILNILLNCSSNLRLTTNLKINQLPAQIKVLLQQSYIATYTDTPELILAQQLGRNIRRNIQQAQSCGYTFTTNINSYSIDDVYKLHCELCTKQHRKPHPLTIYQAIHSAKHISSDINVISASFQNNLHGYIITIASSNEFFLWDIGYAESSLAHNLPSLLMWEAIQLALSTGYQRINFGTSPAKTATIDDFKIRWNTSTEEYFIYSYSSPLFTLLNRFK